MHIMMTYVLPINLKNGFMNLSKDKYSYQCRELAKWIQNAESSGIPEFEKCAATYRRWHKEIKMPLNMVILMAQPNVSTQDQGIKTNIFGLKTFIDFVIEYFMKLNF